MAEETAVPDWVRDCVTVWRDRLQLFHWQIRIQLQPMPAADPETTATVYLYPETTTAVLVVSDKVSAAPSEEWGLVLIHELVHVRLAEVTDFVTEVLIPELAPATWNLANKAFRKRVEPAVEALATTLLELDPAERP